MKFSFTQMNGVDAREILSWRYEKPYDFYDAEPTELEKRSEVLAEAQNAYYALRDEAGDLIGYYCYGREAQVEGGDYTDNAVDVGGGIRPDLTGQGFGATFIRVALDFGGIVYAATKFRVTVAAFNRRALRMCEKAGFVPVQTFTGPSENEFVVLVKEPEDEADSDR